MTLVERPLVGALALASLALVAAIGLVAARRTRTERDFYLAGGRLGPAVAAIATMSAAFSGFLFLGGPGLAYRTGVGSLFICLPVGFTAALLCRVTGERLWEAREAAGALTIPDVLEHRYGGRVVPGLGALAVAAGSLGYLGVQIQALGVLLVELAGLDAALGPEVGRAVGMLAGAMFVLTYAAAGGMRAGVATDVVQGALMAVTGVAVFAHVWRVTGGPAGVAAALGADPHARALLEPFGAVSPATAFGWFFLFSAGTLGQPHLLHKFMMLRRKRDLRFLPLWLGGSQSLCVLLWIGLGLGVPALVATGHIPPLDDPNRATPAYIAHVAPDLLAGLMLAGALAAIMSTGDSFVNLGAAALARDLPRALGRARRPRDAGVALARGRLVSVAFTLAATALAFGYRDLIALLGTAAFGVFAATLAAPLALGLNWSAPTRRAAAWSMLCGLLVCVVLEAARRGAWGEFGSGALLRVPAGAAGMAVSFAVLAVASATRSDTASGSATSRPDTPADRSRSPAPRPTPSR